MSDGERIVRCTVELDLIDGEHFNPFNLPLSNERLIESASSAFVDMLNNIDNSGDLPEYVKCKIVE